MRALTCFVMPSEEGVTVFEQDRLHNVPDPAQHGMCRKSFRNDQGGESKGGPVQAGVCVTAQPHPEAF